MSLPFQTVAAVPNASDANRRDYGIGAPSGPAGRGLLDLSYDLPTGLVTVTYSDLSTQRFGPVKGGPGQKGDDAVPPTFVTGTVTQGPAGSAPTFALRLVQTGVYAIDATVAAGAKGDPGTGNVNGPATSVAGNVPTFGGTDGKTLVDSGKSVAAIIAAAGSGLTRSARIANTQLVAADKGSFVDVTSGTFTQTFDTPANLGAGWSIFYRNSGTGRITIPASDGVSNWVIYPGEERRFSSDGTTITSELLKAGAYVFAASDNFIWPPGWTGAFVETFGGGAGGNGASSSNGSNGGGGGGGGRYPGTAPNPGAGTSVPVVVGAGGTGSAVNVFATNGGTSTFGGKFIANGGLAGSASAASSGAGGSIGSTTNRTASPAVAGVAGISGPAEYGGGGGGSNGAGSVFGGGGGGNGVTSTSASVASGYAGPAGLYDVGGSANGTLPSTGAGLTGTTGTGTPFAGGGGTRGSNDGTTAGLNGGAGGIPSGGGAGGNYNSNVGYGNGGNGGRGEVRIYGLGG